MNKEFSEGFMHDITDLLEICDRNNTDSIELSIEINGKILVIGMDFDVVEMGCCDE